MEETNAETNSEKGKLFLIRLLIDINKYATAKQFEVHFNAFWISN